MLGKVMTRPQKCPGLEGKAGDKEDSHMSNDRMVGVTGIFVCIKF